MSALLALELSVHRGVESVLQNTKTKKFLLKTHTGLKCDTIWASENLIFSAG